MLKSMVAIKQHVLVTDQIVEEVCRNKTNVFSTSFDGYIQQMQTLNGIRLPEHLDDKRITEWNKSFKDLSRNHKNLLGELRQIRQVMVESIVSSKDFVSMQLLPLFGAAVVSSNAHVASANERRNLGSPPGKWSDPIGDQLNWEHILEACEGVSVMIIVSNDYDFYANADREKQFLNPVLLDEMNERNESISVECYNSLSDGLQAYDRLTKSLKSSLPSVPVLERIKEDERLYVPFSGGTGPTHSSDGNETTTYYANPDHARLDSVERVKYMYKNSLMRRDVAQGRLLDLGMGSKDVQDILDNRIVY